MRFIVGMDFHLSLPRIEVGRDLIRETTKMAKDQHCSHVVIVGDLTDEKHGIKTELLSMLHAELKASLEKGVTWIWLRGNHEIPLKSRPELTLMPLFSSVCIPIIEPAVWEQQDGSVLVFLPWYLPQQYRMLAKHLAGVARTYPNRFVVLFSHIGLDEGKVSPSNGMYVNQAVSLRDLDEGAYSRIILGDYHHRQYLSDKTLYGGCPISHAHGDDLNNGLWLLDTATREFSAMPWPRPFPAHRTWELQNISQVLLGYSSTDVNKIIAPRDCVGFFQRRYSTATVVAKAEARDSSSRRLEGLGDAQVSWTSLKPHQIWKRYCDLKNWDEAHWKLGVKTLEDALLRYQAKKG